MRQSVLRPNASARSETGTPRLPHRKAGDDPDHGCETDRHRLEYPVGSYACDSAEQAAREQGKNESEPLAERHSHYVTEGEKLVY